MDQLLARNKLLRFLEERTSAELRLASDEVKLWNDSVANGLLKREQVKPYIESAKRIIDTKLHLSGFPEFPN
jgi:hypothetical protein